MTNAFTCTGSYAVLILYGIKRTENRSAWPEPCEGRAAISCSKSCCKEEYGQFIAWASVNLSLEDFEKLPACREVKDWPGKVVGVCDYSARQRREAESLDEGQTSQRRPNAEQGRLVAHFRHAIHRAVAWHQVPRPPHSRLARLRRWKGICVGSRKVCVLKDPGFRLLSRAGRVCGTRCAEERKTG